MNTANKTFYFKNLDALRLLTFLFVFLRHGFFSNNPEIEQNTLSQWRNSFFNSASIGLDFFSVLSSFLITWLILKEYEVKKEFKMKNFFMRRILRIWPLYILILLIAYAAVPFICGRLNIPAPELPPISWFLFFGANYYVAYVDQDFIFFLVFLWFISVEEQFYFVWAFVMKYLKNYLITVCLLLVVVYISVKYIYFNTQFPSFYDTLDYLPDFAAGAFLAYSYMNRNLLFTWLQNRTGLFWSGMYITFLLSVIFYNQIYENIHVDNFKHIILSVFFSLILFEQCFREKPVFNLSKYNFINYLGKLNYGLYCWHGVVITVAKKALDLANYQDSYWDVFLIYPVITLAITIGLSIISFEFYEKKFLKLKMYFSGIN